MLKRIGNKDIGKEYKRGIIQTINLYYIQEVNKILFSKISFFDSKRKAKKILKYSESYVEEFKEVLGKQDFMFRYEYNNYAWVVEYAGCKAIIFSGKGKGTSVEVICENGKPIGDVLAFFYKFTDLLNYINNER